MTKANLSSAQNLPKHQDDDEIQPEYNLTGNGTRGKYAKAMRENGYSITVHHEDGTSTTRQISPREVLEQQRQRQQLRQSATPTAPSTWNGDRISGDKVMGDKVAGNKTQIGTVQGDAIAGNKIVNSQNLTQAAQDIKALLDQLAIDYPNEDEFIQGGRALSAIKKDPTLKTRLINAAKEAGIAAFEKTVEAITDNPAAGSIVAGIKGFIEADG
jgi:hypothetical protein